MEERNTNHVRREWESDRRKERDEMEKKMKEEMIARERAMVEESLKHILPFGWVKDWQQGEQQNQDDGHFVYRRIGDKKVVEEQTARPYYTYDDMQATIKIQCAMKVSSSTPIILHMLVCDLMSLSYIVTGSCGKEDLVSFTSCQAPKAVGGSRTTYLANKGERKK